MNLPPGLTREAYYLRQIHRGSRRRPDWTRESILAITALFVQEEGYFPSNRYLASPYWMPSWDSIKRCFGDAAGFLRAFRTEYPALPMLRPRKRYAPYVHHPKGPTERVVCLSCDRPFSSPDKRLQRICPTCHERDDPDAGMWIAGVAVIDAGYDIADLMEMELPYGH